LQSKVFTKYQNETISNANNGPYFRPTAKNFFFFKSQVPYCKVVWHLFILFLFREINFGVLTSAKGGTFQVKLNFCNLTKSTELPLFSLIMRAANRYPHTNPAASRWAPSSPDRVKLREV